MGDSYDGSEGHDSIDSGETSLASDSGYDSSVFDSVDEYEFNELGDFEDTEDGPIKSDAVSNSSGESDKATDGYSSNHLSEFTDVYSGEYTEDDESIRDFYGEGGNYFAEDSDEMTNDISDYRPSAVNEDFTRDVDEIELDEFPYITDSGGDDETPFDSGDDLNELDDVINIDVDKVDSKNGEGVKEKIADEKAEETEEMGGILAEKKDVDESTGFLTLEERAGLQKETNWTDDIIDSIGSLEEAQVYKEADLKETEIDGKTCLIREDIDLSIQDEFGRTNLERMSEGLAPIREDGSKIELHHIGQKADSPLAELTMQEHRGKGNDSILHDKTKESDIDRPAFDGERQAHWEARAKELSREMLFSL